MWTPPFATASAEANLIRTRYFMPMGIPCSISVNVGTHKMNLIIIGAGGLAKEVYGYVLDNARFGAPDVPVRGVLDDNPANHDAKELPIPYLGKIADYELGAGDAFTIAIADVRVRSRIIDALSTRGARFHSVIHRSVYIAHDATIGQGVIIAPYCIVNANSSVGDLCLLNTYSSIGHDSSLGRNSVLSPHCHLNGNVKTGANLFMGTRSTILLGSRLGDNCTIASHTQVSGKKADNMMFKAQTKTIETVNRLI